jgi:hypothetical protein
MGFFKEGAAIVEIDGKECFSAEDADGASLGLFSTVEAALGAQRIINIKKLSLRKLESERAYYEGIIELWHGRTRNFVATFDDGWVLARDSFEEQLNQKAALKPY